MCPAPSTGSSSVKTIFRALAVAGALATSAAIPAFAQDIKVGLSLPEGMADFDFINGMYETFKSEVEANSDMTVDIVYGGALGAPNDRLAQMRRGVIQMSDAADGNIATVFPDIQILNMPYLFSSIEQARAVLDGEFGDALAESLREETGIKVLGWWESGGFKHFSASTPIATPADMEGLKMRVLGPLATIPVEALGASAAPVAFSELYTSLKTGVVDGQDNSVTVFNLVKLYEVQPHLSLTAHTYAFGPLGINDGFFSGLDADKQAVIMAAAEAAITFNRDTSSAKDSAAVDFARENGVEVLELDDAAKAAFAEIMQPVAIEWLKENVDTPALVDEAISAAEAE